jgi:hypothetical protein
MQAVLNLVWDRLLSGMKADALPADEASAKQLHAKLASLLVSTPKASASAKVPSGVSGKKFSFSSNEQKIDSIGLEFGTDGKDVTLIGKFNDGEEQRIACGNGEWKKTRVAFGRMPLQPIAVSGAWSADDTYTAKICFYETPYALTVRLAFSEDKLRLDSTMNVSFGATKPQQLIGERK